MPIIKISEFRAQTDEQLIMTLRDLEKDLFKSRFESSSDRMETPSEIRKAKRDIARIKTLQREREMVKEQEALELAALASKAPKPTPVPAATATTGKGKK